MATPLCISCGNPIPDDGRPRERKRARKCKPCQLHANLSKRRKDPVKQLQHRFINNARNWWPASYKTVSSMETVRAVWERCQHASVISPNPAVPVEYLRIVPKLAVPRNPAPTGPDDLVVVTSVEDRRLKAMTPAARALCFQ